MSAMVSVARARHLRHKRKATLICSINMTPMVDLVLVLLVIFMVAAPLTTSMIHVQLPKISKASAGEAANDTHVIALDGEGKLYLDDTPVTKSQLLRDLQRLSKNKKEDRILLKADKSLTYQHIIATIDAIKNSGMKNVALVTLTQHGTKKRNDR